MPREQLRGCRICESLNRAFVCPGCVNKNIVDDRWKVLAELRDQRQQLLDRLNQLLKAKAELTLQQVQREDAALQNHAAQEQAAQLQQKLQQARAAAAKLKAQTQQRRAQIEGLNAQLAAARSAMFTAHLPTHMRYQSLTYSHVTSMLAREQRQKVRELLEIFPLRISALHGQTGPPIKVTICNLKLPEGGPASSSSWGEAEAVDAAFGYVLLLVELLACYMGGPTLHEGLFKGSTSLLWTPQSFWSRAPSNSTCILPLYLTSGVQGAGTLSAISSRTSARSSAARGAAGGSDSPLTELLPETNQARQRSADLRLAYDVLLRSLSCFLRDKSATYGIQLPQAWSPFSWLVIFCSYIKKDPRVDGVIMAASALADAQAGGEGLSILMSGTMAGTIAPAGGRQALGQMGYEEMGDEDEEGEGGLGGWDLINAAPLPPPPSCPEEVEHWTRAMFTDASAAAQRLAGLQAAQVANAAGQIIGADKIKGLLRRPNGAL